MSNEIRTNTEAAPMAAAGAPVWLYALAVVGVAVGLVSFIAMALSANPAPVWRALLVNFLLWGSLAQGAVVWSAILRTARTTWSAPINRLGHAACWYLPFSLVAFAVLMLGRRYWLPWIGRDVGDLGVWLNVPFLLARDGIGLAALSVVSFAYVRTYLRVDTAPLERQEEMLAAADRRLAVLGVALIALYGIVYTIIGFDLGMSLDPHWHSALYGAYFSCGGLYAAMAALIIMAAPARRRLGLATQQIHDLGNLLMTLAMLMTYLFYSQALPIWYANLPGETSFAVRLVNVEAWRRLAWVVLAAAYLGPFALLVAREMKQNPRTLMGVALLVVAAMWLERYMLVAPVLVRRVGEGVAPELLVGLGFLGVFVLTTGLFLSRYPAVSRLDLELKKQQEAAWQ